MRNFVVLSFVLHLSLLALSGFADVEPDRVSTPIKITLLDPESVMNEDLPVGRIMETAKPEKEQVPKGEPKILSYYDTQAKSPEKGNEYKATQTAYPKKRIDLPHPSEKPADENVTAKKPEKQKTTIASLVKPKVTQKERSTAKEINVFSEDLIELADETKETELFEKSDKEEKQKREKMSALMTDSPDPESKSMFQETGTPDVESSEISPFVMSDTGDVVDMGDEAIVSLNTKAFKYMDYFVSIRKAVESVWSYPEDAVIHGLAGRAVIKFTITNDGELESVRVLKSSGYMTLDDEAQLAVKAAAPYDAFPQSLGKKKLHIVATFMYKPTFHSVR
ncbi:hypothetical protein MNBD_NITROSPINAE01-941 [hydrothermal vent metagenome]|uniref:TonB C-terminal domain-containing protein n=1 Tax=hydrothermal vent metagenome TaxID=652676 RepID=A0A3B1CER3_9ZZZZ